MLLTKPPRTILGREVETGFRKWLRFAQMWQSSELTVAEKSSLSLLNVLGEATDDPEAALSAVMEFYLCGKETRGEPARERLIDWEQDGDCIWADFLIYAGIDLRTAELHWWEFMALFGSLPSESGIKRRIELRATDLSKIHDAATREEYRKAKEDVSLNRTEDAGLDEFYGKF